MSVTRRTFLALVTSAPLALVGCTAVKDSVASKGGDSDHGETADVRELGGYVLTEGSQTDRGFVVDDALQTPSGRTLHFSLHVPDSYDGSVPYALYVACPGWEVFL